MDVANLNAGKASGPKRSHTVNFGSALNSQSNAWTGRQRSRLLPWLLLAVTAVWLADLLWQPPNSGARETGTQQPAAKPQAVEIPRQRRTAGSLAF